MAKTCFKMQLEHAKYVQKRQSIHVKDAILFIAVELAK